MKKVSNIRLLILFLTLLKVEAHAEEVLFKREESSKAQAQIQVSESFEALPQDREEDPTATKDVVIIKKIRRAQPTKSNLPVELQRRNPQAVQVSNDVVIVNQKRSVSEDFYLGDKYYSQIRSSVIAFPGEAPTIRAEVLQGKLRGAIFLGVATLEKNSKRILMKFTKVQLPRGRAFEIEAEALSLTGEPWFMGKYFSKEVQYFTADFLSSMASAYFDGRIERTTNVFGNVQEVPSVDSAANKGLASGSKELANRFREKLKSSPEFSVLQGPIDIEILITNQAKALK